MKKFSLITLIICATAFPAIAEEHSHAQAHIKEVDWSFNGIFGTVDKQSAQRGFQVYKEVCSACHSLHRVAFRSLKDIGFSEGEVKALAAGYQINDGPNDAGEMFQRPGRPSDLFSGPFANEQAARAANNGAYPPDLSLIIKARHDGANYVYSILTGYDTPPADMVMNTGMYYNHYFPGNQIAMPPPLNADGQVTYEDGTVATREQMAHDVVNFLQWAAEPEMEHRKQMGIKVILFLLVLTIFAFMAKRRVWSDVE